MALSADELAELQRLLPVARTARRQHAQDSPQRRASARVTEILALAHAEERATVRELSAATGISYHSVARRIRLATGGPVRRPKRPRERTPRPAETTIEEAASPGRAQEPGEENVSSAREFQASLLPDLPAPAPRPVPEPPAEELDRFAPGPNDVPFPEPDPAATLDTP